MFNMIQRIDETILFFIHDNLRNPTIDRVMVFITSLGDAGFLWILITFLLLAQKRYRKCGIFLVCALILEQLICNDILKPLIGRVRPCNKFPDVVLLIHRMHTASFPSGHTMNGFVSATILFYFHRSLGIVAYAIASLIAFSRLYLFVHYPSDVLAGAVFGVITALMTIYAMKAIHNTINESMYGF